MNLTKIESVVSPTDQVWNDTTHYVCHCKEDNFAWCGTDVTGEAWVDDPPQPCPLCELAGDISYPACPFGCECEEECSQIE